MQNASLELSLLSIFSLVSFFIFLLIQKFSNLILSGDLLDDDFVKPQSFHEKEIPRSGGLASIISLFFFIFLNELIFNIFYFEYFVIGLGMFLIGFLEDLKIRLSPKVRLTLMAIFLLFCINFYSFEINNKDLIFLNDLLNFNIFFVVFILLCFLFIINGANLIDGFDGLLALQLLLINSVLLIINLENNSYNQSLLITAQLITLAIFFVFNFPKAKIFMGDGGAYFFGAITSINIIYTNNLNGNISSFFYCILLFYLFFEVFFSFFRKIIQKKSPIKPDQYHLHMLSFKYLEKKTKFKNCNYINSALINFIYFILIFPAFFVKDNGAICKYWFFLILLFYIFIYTRLNSFIKKQIDI